MTDGKLTKLPSSQTLLQQLLKQLVATQAELHAANGGLGQKFQLSEHISWLKRKADMDGLDPSHHSRRQHNNSQSLENGANGVADMDADGIDH